jgi:hypothetical protein
MHTIGQSRVDSHPSFLNGNPTACQKCHGMDYKGTFLSELKVDKVLAGRTFTATHMISCYDCHNGPEAEAVMTRPGLLTPRQIP